MSERYRIVFSGSGGQGVITASILLSEAAVFGQHRNAVQTQVYGAAARGGATRSDVIISDETINYPKVDQPNILVCLTQEAYAKYADLIRPGGLLLTDSRYVTPQRRIDARQAHLPMYAAVVQQIGKPIVFNICVLGALAALSDVVSTSALVGVIQKRIPKHFISLNLEALQLGYEIAQPPSQRAN